MVSKTNGDSCLSHTKWNGEYHIVFILKLRRKVIYGKLRADIGQILRQLYGYKNVEIIEAHEMSEHIHMFLKKHLKYGNRNWRERLLVSSLYWNKSNYFALSTGTFAEWVKDNL